MRLGTSERPREAYIKRPNDQEHAGDHEQRRVREGGVDAEDLEGEEALDLKLMDGVRHSAATLCPVFCCHVPTPVY